MISHNSLETSIRACFGDDTNITSEIRASGGDINSARILTLTGGKKVFLKYNSIGNSGFFDAEEEGLEAIAQTGTIRTPKLFAKGTDRERGIAFLVMELIETGRADKDTWYVMGREYAAMHMADTKSFVPGGVYGFKNDNYIGGTKQINTPKDRWVDFFRECRLEPQFKMAQRAIGPYAKDIIRLLDRLGDILPEPLQPSLLHGDMWGGNHLVDKNGTAVLIDPAVYVGHPEADIAMTEMFGSMPGDFYKAYYELIPMQDGYRDRKDLYNLYHYMNHFNLFGGSYLSSAMRIVRYYA